MDLENQNRMVDDNTIDVPGIQYGQPATDRGAPEPDANAAGTPSPVKGKDTHRLNLLRNLRSGLRMALLRRVDSDGLRAAAGDLAFLAVTDLVLNLIVSFLLVGAGGEFNYPAFPSFFFHLPLMLLCGLLAGRLLDRRELVTLLPVALISLSIPIELCHGALEGMSHLHRLAWLERYLNAPHYYRFFWWWTAAATLFLVRLGQVKLSRSIALMLLFPVLVVFPLTLFPRGDLWVGGEEQSESGELRLTEEVLAAQSRLLDKQLAGLLPGGKSGPVLYFVGFAGDATQDVFMRELTAVERLMSERFGAAGRTVTLVNNPRTATSLPFATATNLDRTLERVGRVMNRDEDILFLFLTSHGTPEHVLAVENGPLELDGLTPEMVRRMLKKSGATWKVLVVSACYAGGFVEPLKNDHTLIITAADATHESFGCSSGEKFTWFGKAYFDEAMRGSYSFTTAFNRARETIRKWEAEQGETPSNPQIWIGQEMERKLVQLEKRLAAGGGTVERAEKLK
jgi:hypothetical protein